MTNLERLGREIRSEQDALSHRAEARAEVRRRLLATTEETKKPALRARAGVLLAATLSLSLLALLVWKNQAQRGPSVLVGRAQLSAAVGTWIHASESEALPLTFSDGTRVEMAPKSRARVLVLEPGETRLLLESGRVHVVVAHRQGQNFSLATGPFNVRVTGTRFDVSWLPERDQFELALAEGQVELSGCVFGNGRKLAAGQKVQASCKTPRLEIAYTSSAAAATISSSAPEAPGLGPSLTPSADASSASGKETEIKAPPTHKAEALAPRANWLELARAGNYPEAFAAAEALGFEVLCNRTSASELSLLAESARHTGQLAKARSGFTTLRRRFPAAKEAGLAAFSLGLLEFDGFGAYAKAAEWFQIYLKERPGGPLTREARGRVMEAMHRTGRRTEARNLALTYLLDYSAGPHAELARRIVSSP